MTTDGENADVPPAPEPEEPTREEQHLPTTEERLEHCYDEIRTLRAEIAELRSHSHAELAHSSHEHEEYSRHDHAHDVPHDAERTSIPTEEHESGGGATNDNQPDNTHWYFRKIGSK